MPNVSRPDLLPFARSARIGLPYHGVCTDAKLGENDYPQPVGGDTLLVQHPLSSTPRPDKNTTYAWKDHAILSGATKQIGGQELGANHWIYCDDHYSWDISFAFIKAGVTQTITVWLEKPFGLFPEKTMDRRQLCELTFTPVGYDGIAQNSDTALWDRVFFSSHSKTGSVSIINIGATVPDALTAQVWDKTSLPMALYVERDLVCSGFHNAVKITLSGNGSLEKGNIGNGINAVIEMQRDSTQMIITNTSSITVEPEDFFATWYQPLDDTQTVIYDPAPCPPTSPPYTDLGTLEWNHYDVVLLDTDTFTEVGTASSQTTTAQTVKEVRFLDTVLPGGGLSYLQILVDNVSTTVRSTSVSGSGVDADLHHTSVPSVGDPSVSGCVDGEHVYTLGPLVLSGSNTITAQKDFDGTVDISISWCGALYETSIVISGSATEIDTVEVVVDPTANYSTVAEIDEYSYTQDGVVIEPPVSTGIHKITNNLLEVSDAIRCTVLDILGATHQSAVFLDVNEATLNPATGELVVDKVRDVCWV